MRNLRNASLAIATMAAFNLGGAAVLAETPVPVPFDEPVLTDDPCDPVEGPCGDPDPDPGPAFPGVDSYTDDSCDPVEGPCGDPDPVPDPDPDPEPEPEPQPEPEPDPCTLDDVCTRTPTFTG